jgi:hypothetical protein
MKIEWSDPIRIDRFYEDWDSMPSSPGIYIIRTLRSVRRIGGVDTTGVLYVGRASRLRSRIWKFWKANHTASGFLWTHPHIASLVLKSRIHGPKDVEGQLGKLMVRYATPIQGRALVLAERAVLFSYVNRFGEAPPLNLCLPTRWDSPPTSIELRWAEHGILERA